MQIGGEGIENLLINMVLEKKNLEKKANPKRHLYVPLYFRIG
jgi:hypothetical protein